MYYKQCTGILLIPKAALKSQPIMYQSKLWMIWRAKDRYVREGVHIGMQGWICFNECSDGYWLVNFPQYGAKKDIATISMKEDDLKVTPKMDAKINEGIKAEFDKSDDAKKGYGGKPDDLSGYLI